LKYLTIKELIDTIDRNPIYTGMQTYQTRIRLCLTDVMEPLLFCGGLPGVGKSHHFFAISKELGKSYHHLAPGADPHSFVNAIYHYGEVERREASLLDDHDKLLSAPKAREIVKAGWGPERAIHWQTKSAMNKGDPPPFFRVHSKLLWLSNQNASDLDDLDLQAIFDRGANPMFIEGPDAALFRYVIYMVIHNNFFRRRDGFAKRAQAEALNWFNANRHHLKRISLRTIQSATRYIHRCGVDEDSKRKALSSLLGTKRQRKEFPGFRHPLKMVEPGIWQEIKMTTSLERAEK
jgi:hypothetical protein